jgi:hypothetical protein
VPAVLVYRLVSLWMLVGIGALVLVATPAGRRRTPDDSAQAQGS